jgi:hypothetical protein
MNFKRGTNRYFLAMHKSLALLLLLVTMYTNVTWLPGMIATHMAEAAVVLIDDTGQTAGTSHLILGSQTVFVSDQVGYKFYRDASGECVYAKTTNAGGSWAFGAIVDDQGTGTDCISISVWYEPWTPGRTNQYIHIATLDTTNDDVFYNRLDTSSDTLLSGSTAINTNNANTQIATAVAGANIQSITVSTDGTVYVSLDDTSDSYVLRCATACGSTASWSEAGTRPQDLVNDYSILVPLTAGDIMLINRDISADDIRSKIWDVSAGSWSGTWTTIDANATENTVYDGGMAVVSDSSGTVYLAYTANNATLGTDDQIRTARYQSGSWSARTSPLTATTRGITGVSLARDTSTNAIYVGYSARTTAGTSGTGNVYWKRSTDGMGVWSAEVGPINTSANDIYGVDLNSASNQRIYATWFGVTGADVLGETVADLVPGVLVSSIGSQIAGVSTPVTNEYIGGTFVFQEYIGSRDITAVTLSEIGTINASTMIENVELYYENDTSAPYDCQSESYSGLESQFGSTDSNGFSGSDGVSTFSGTSATVSTTSAVCMYVVLDVNDLPPGGETLDIEITNPSTDVTITGSDEVNPTTPVTIAGVTNIFNDAPTLTHFHFRNDNGSETTATSRTGGNEDTNLTALSQNTPFRLRLGVSNEGGTSTPAIQYRLEYSLAAETCELADGWTDVGASNDDFNMFDSSNLTDGANTTNIAEANGGVTDENTTFRSPNGGVKDTSSQTAGVTLTPTQHTDLEFSLVATASATEGNTYCFRVTDAGTPLSSYAILPRVTIAADVSVNVTGTQTATANIPTSNLYLGGAFTIVENTGTRDVQSITLTETGTVDASADITDPQLYYEYDTVAPFDCASVSFAGTESVVSGSALSSTNGTTTFSLSGVTITSGAQAFCGYVVADVGSTATNGETLNFVIQNPSTDVVVSGGGSVSPTITRDISGDTTLQGSELTQTHYHWRSDDGSETTATSLTGGNEDTPITHVAQNEPVRLRMQVSNEGSVTTPDRALRLEYGTKVTTCENISSWTDVGSNSAWQMNPSANLTEGANTTNIAEGNGGVTDENTVFKSPNSAVKDTSSQVATTTIASNEYLEAEFSLIQTANAAYGTTYCFRLSHAGEPIYAYSTYPELTTDAERDFEIQRGTVTITGTSATITAGVDYVAPASLNNAFIRITNTQHTGAGGNVGGGNQPPDDVTAYITNPENLLTSIDFVRFGATNNTRVSWEIIEFIGTPGSDNEMIVHDQDALIYAGTDLTVTGASVGGVTDDSDVVVFVTGVVDPGTATGDYPPLSSTAQWDGTNDQPIFTRGNSDVTGTGVSYAIVEFTGPNWKIQRSEHTYTSAGVTESESITPVNSLSRTFLHTQKRVGTALTGIDEVGHEVWLSSIGAVSYVLQNTATTPSDQTSVAWIIENTQTTNGSMLVTRSDGNTINGTEPLSLEVPIGTTLDDLTNASIFTNSRAAGTGNAHPRAIAGVTIMSSTTYEIWRSDTGTQLNYRTEVVEWPTAGLGFRQNDYRFYVDNDAVTPTDPHPLGASDLGENTSITSLDEPLGDGDIVRIRMSLTVLNASFPEQSRAFKLQYAERISTCSAVASWTDVGAIGSGAIWRGFSMPAVTDGSVLSTEPPTNGDLLLAVSDHAGTIEEQNPSEPNPYTAPEGTDVEYDWIVQQNGATAETPYCFRMVESNDTVFNGYADYPQLFTASFTPRTQNWRFYSDVENETPSTALADENVTPIEVGDNDTLKLRVTIAETENIARQDVRFRLQYSEYPDFSVAYEVTATSTCTATSTWCYHDGAGSDNAVIQTTTLSDVDSCVAGVGDGCGTRTESALYYAGHRHENGADAEYEFTLTAKAPRANAVYYFRPYETTLDMPAETNTGETYPSVVIEGASLVFSVAGLPSGTTTESVVTDIPTSANALDFGSIQVDSLYTAAHRLSVETNATEGYQVLMLTDQDLMNAYGTVIDPIAGTNPSPVSWAVGCNGIGSGCFGYHVGDEVLQGGSARFAPDDSFAAFSSTPYEVMYSSIPANDMHDIVYRLYVNEELPAGTYETHITYIAVPVF